MTNLEDLAAIAAILGAATGIASLIVSVNEVRQGRKMIDSFTKVVRSYEQSVKSYEREVGDLRKGTLDMEKEIKMRELEQMTREREWGKIKDIAKGVKFIVEKQKD
jgi:hypothetical protein